MEHDRYRKRLDALFGDIERLNTSPAAETATMRQELASVQARLCELEAEFKALKEAKNVQVEPSVAQAEQPAPIPASSVRSAPILYEKERIGFAFVDDELKPVEKLMLEGANPEKLINMPLLVAGQAVGEVKFEAPGEKELSTDELSFAHTVAQQASLQIQSLRLIESAERARTEAEQATRQYMHQSWETYLDAIHQDERVGYAYDQAAVTSYTETVTPVQGIHQNVSVMDEQVGTLFVQPSPERPLTQSDLNMVRSGGKANRPTG